MKYLIGLIAGLLLITACTNSAQNQTQTQTKLFVGGTQGLVATFEAMGPEENGMWAIFEGDTFPIQVLLQNNGEYNLAKGDVSIKLQGISLSDFSGITAGQLSNPEVIEGVSQTNPDGSQQIIDFGQSVKYNQPLPGSFYDVNVFGIYDYRYKTSVVAPDVCFKENLQDTRVCDVQGTKDVFSSAAPVQVTSATENSAGSGKVEVDFVVENAGTGKVTIPGTAFGTYDQLSYQIEPESDRVNWRCSQAGRDNQARLDSTHKATIRCLLINSLPKDALYTKQISLTLDYMYESVVQGTVRIKKNA